MITTLDAMIAHVREKTHESNVLLSFSGGKDAWAAWLPIRDHFTVTPFYYYVVPGLEIVEDYLAYCEGILGKIRQYPHPMLYAMLSSCTSQAPQRTWVLDHTTFPMITKDDIHRCVEHDAGLPKDSCYTALGLRAADSIMRGSHFKKHGPVDDKRKVFNPVWDWNKARLVEELKRNGIKLSKEYAFFGRTMDGPVLLYSWGLKQHAPRDYQRLLEWFPMIESQVWRYERHLAKGGN